MNSAELYQRLRDAASGALMYQVPPTEARELVTLLEAVANTLLQRDPLQVRFSGLAEAIDANPVDVLRAYVDRVRAYDVCDVDPEARADRSDRDVIRDAELEAAVVLSLSDWLARRNERGDSVG